MAGTGWRERKISDRQLATIDRVKGEKVVGALDETLLDILADIESEVPVTQGQASDLLDALFALPRKPRVFKEETAATLVSTWEARKAKADAAWAAYETAQKTAAAAAAAAGGTAKKGDCTSCHKPFGGRGEDGTCGNQLEWKGSDYYEYYPCSGKAIGTEATEAAGALYRAEQIAYKAADEARNEADEFVKGDWAVNVRGRKIAKGTVGQVVFVKHDGQYGPSVLLLVDGKKVWTSLKNVEHIEAPA